MTALDHPDVDLLPGSQASAPKASLRPGDIDLSDPETFLSGVPNEYFRVLKGRRPSTLATGVRDSDLPAGPGLLGTPPLRRHHFRVEAP